MGTGLTLCGPNLHQIAMKRALPSQIRQCIGRRPVDVAAIHRQPRPWAFRSNGDARRHIIGDDRAKATPAARALDDHLIAIADRARRRVGRVDLDERLAFFGDQAGLVGQAAGDVVMRGARDEH
jgi:hypothetical protein